MLAIARALVRDPKIILLDEPFEGLAPVIVRDLIKACRDLADAGQTIMLVEQNLAAALTLGAARVHHQQRPYCARRADQRDQSAAEGPGTVSRRLVGSAGGPNLSRQPALKGAYHTDPQFELSGGSWRIRHPVRRATRIRT